MEINQDVKDIIDNWCKLTKNKVEYTDNGFRIIPILERKGAYVKELSELDNDLPIVNRALVNYIAKGIPVEETINSSNDMIDFQKIFHVSSKFKLGWHNWKELTDKTYRVYASTDNSDTYLGRCRESGENPNKFGNCPEHCFIYNKEVKGVPLSKKLD